MSQPQRQLCRSTITYLLICEYFAQNLVVNCFVSFLFFVHIWWEYPQCKVDIFAVWIKFCVFDRYMDICLRTTWNSYEAHFVLTNSNNCNKRNLVILSSKRQNFNNTLRISINVSTYQRLLKNLLFKISEDEDWPKRYRWRQRKVSYPLHHTRRSLKNTNNNIYFNLFQLLSVRGQFVSRTDNKTGQLIEHFRYIYNILIVVIFVWTDGQNMVHCRNFWS